MQIIIHFLKQVPSLNLNPEVDFWLHGRHLKKSVWTCHGSPDYDKIWQAETKSHADD